MRIHDRFNLRPLSAIGAMVALHFAAVPAVATTFGEERSTNSITQQGSPVAAQPNVTPEAGTLLLRAGSFDTIGLADARETAGDRFADNRRYVVQLDGPITPERRAQLEEAGVVLGEYLPAYAYLADLANVEVRGLDPAFDGPGFITWVGEWRDEWKIDPELGQREFLTPERQQMAERGQAGVIITLFRALAPHDTVDALNELGAVVHWTDVLAHNAVISATLMLEDVLQLASLGDVQYVEEAWEITPRNNNVRWVVQSNELNVTPLYEQGLRGEGQIAGVLDTRLDANHCSFVDPGVPIGPDHRKIVAYNTSSGAASHGTHVSGIVVGDAGAWTNTRGVAHEGKVAYNTWPSFTESAIYQRFTLHHGQGARDHTNSWGDDWTTAYNGLARGIDLFQWEYEESQTYWAVTNMSALKNPENAKNTLAVGATSPPPNQHNHCTGGTGPTSDGRRKPEIYAPGCSTVSSTPGSCSTGSMSGTSMASPAIAGVGMLARQYYMDGFYPTGASNPSDAFVPSGALVKATLLNSAVDMTGVSGYPSNLEGWGRALADKALHFEGDARGLIVQDVWNANGLSTGEVDEYQFTVSGSDQKLKVTLVWTDYPGAVGTNFAAVNDLDLEVVGPNGAFLGNVFSDGISVPGGDKDDRNNVEQVHVAEPGDGVWTVRVHGYAVNQATQGYALVVSGDVMEEGPPLTILLPNDPPTLIDPDEPTHFDVHITPGEESIAPGSEMLFFRAGDDGTFQSVALSHVQDDLYLATLPPGECDQLMEFYLSASGSEGSIVTLPADAPETCLFADVGRIVTDVILEERFDQGIPADWAVTGLWHVASECIDDADCPTDQVAYYGIVASCTYETGQTHSGTLESAILTIPEIDGDHDEGDAVVMFCHNLEAAASSGSIRARFLINGNIVDSFLTTDGWETYAVDVSEFSGSEIVLSWYFYTSESGSQDALGWQIDNVVLSTSEVDCNTTILGDLNGDGVVNVDDLLIVLNSWGDCADCDDCIADITGDCTVNVDDLLNVLNNWG